MAQVSAGALIALNDFHYLPQPLRQMAGYQLDHHYVLPNAFHFFIGLVWFGLVWFGLVWLSIQSHVQHWTCQLHITIYNITCNIWTSTQYNTINNNKKFEDQLEVEFVITSQYMCIYINIPKS